MEKDSTFQKLIDDKIECFIGQCILITVRNFKSSHSRSTHMCVLCSYREKVIRMSTLAVSCVAYGTNCNYPLSLWWMQIHTEFPSLLSIDSEVKYVAKAKIYKAFSLSVY